MDKAFLICLITSISGTLLGGIIGATSSKSRPHSLGVMLAFASGVMIGVTSFNIIPTIFALIDPILSVIYIMVSVIAMACINEIVSNYQNKKHNNIPKLGLVLMIALSLHNFPEGLMMGSVSTLNIQMGIMVAIAMILHDIPEGMIIAASFRNSNYSFIKSLIPVIVSILFTFIGSILGIIYTVKNANFQAISLSLASGAMLYVSYSEIIPEALTLTNRRNTAIFTIIGILLGIFLS